MIEQLRRIRFVATIIADSHPEYALMLRESAESIERELEQIDDSVYRITNELRGLEALH